MEPTAKELLNPTRPAPGRANAITAADVEEAAGALLRKGEKPTIDRVRVRIGRGSPNTIAPLLDLWWVKVGQLFDERVPGPKPLVRVPESVAQVAEHLFIEALLAARIRVEADGATTLAHLAQREQHLVEFGAVLSAREREMTQELIDLRLVDRRLRADNEAWRATAQEAQARVESLARRIKTLEIRFKKSARSVSKARNPTRRASALRVQAQRRIKKRRGR